MKKARSSGSQRPTLECSNHLLLRTVVSSGKRRSTVFQCLHLRPPRPGRSGFSGKSQKPSKNPPGHPQPKPSKNPPKRVKAAHQKGGGPPFRHAKIHGPKNRTFSGAAGRHGFGRPFGAHYPHLVWTEPKTVYCTSFACNTSKCPRSRKCPRSEVPAKYPRGTREVSAKYPQSVRKVPRRYRKRQSIRNVSATYPQRIRIVLTNPRSITVAVRSCIV